MTTIPGRLSIALALGLLLLSCQSGPGMRADTTPADGAATSDAGPADDAELPTNPGPAPDATLEVLSINPDRSEVSFTGSRERATHTRSFLRFGGEVRLDGEEPAEVWVVLDIKSVAHSQDAFTTHLLSSELLGSLDFPTAGFKSTRITPLKDGEHTHLIEGMIEIRGVRRVISFPATITVTAEAVHGEALVVLDRQDFGVDLPGIEGDAIEDEVPMWLVLEASRCGSK